MKFVLSSFFVVFGTTSHRYLSSYGGGGGGGGGSDVSLCFSVIGRVGLLINNVKYTCNGRKLLNSKVMKNQGNIPAH